jgi:hypothetical protein
MGEAPEVIGGTVIVRTGEGVARGDVCTGGRDPRDLIRNPLRWHG